MNAPQSTEKQGLGFAFFRAHCIAYEGSGCIGMAERMLGKPSCALIKFDGFLERNKTALRENQS